jgi:hypothetical protein
MVRSGHTDDGERGLRLLPSMRAGAVLLPLSSPKRGRALDAALRLGAHLSAP